MGIPFCEYDETVRYDVEHLLFLMEKMEEIAKQFIDRIEKIKKKKIEILTSIKGIGNVTTSCVIAEIKDINRFNKRSHLIAYEELTPL